MHSDAVEGGPHNLGGLRPTHQNQRRGPSVESSAFRRAAMSTSSLSILITAVIALVCLGIQPTGTSPSIIALQFAEAAPPPNCADAPRVSIALLTFHPSDSRPPSIGEDDEGNTFPIDDTTASIEAARKAYGYTVTVERCTYGALTLWSSTTVMEPIHYVTVVLDGVVTSGFSVSSSIVLGRGTSITVKDSTIDGLTSFEASAGYPSAYALFFYTSMKRTTTFLRGSWSSGSTLNLTNVVAKTANIDAIVFRENTFMLGASLNINGGTFLAMGSTAETNGILFANNTFSTNAMLTVDGASISGSNGLNMATDDVQSSCVVTVRNCALSSLDSTPSLVSMRLRMIGGRVDVDGSNVYYGNGDVRVYHAANTRNNRFIVTQQSWLWGDVQYVFTNPTLLYTHTDYVEISDSEGIDSVTITMPITQTNTQTYILRSEIIHSATYTQRMDSHTVGITIIDSSVGQLTLSGGGRGLINVTIFNVTTTGSLSCSLTTICSFYSPCFIAIEGNNVNGSIGGIGVYYASDYTTLTVRNNIIACYGNCVAALLFYTITNSVALSVSYNTIYATQQALVPAEVPPNKPLAVRFNDPLAITRPFEFWGNTLVYGGMYLRVGYTPVKVSFIGNHAPTFDVGGGVPPNYVRGDRLGACNTVGSSNLEYMLVASGFSTSACGESSFVVRCDGAVVQSVVAPFDDCPTIIPTVPTTTTTTTLAPTTTPTPVPTTTTTTMATTTTLAPTTTKTTVAPTTTTVVTTTTEVTTTEPSPLTTHTTTSSPFVTTTATKTPPATTTDADDGPVTTTMPPATTTPAPTRAPQRCGDAVIRLRTTNNDDDGDGSSSSSPYGKPITVTRDGLGSLGFVFEVAPLVTADEATTTTTTTVFGATTTATGTLILPRFRMAGVGGGVVLRVTLLATAGGGRGSSFGSPTPLPSGIKAPSADSSTDSSDGTPFTVMVPCTVPSGNTSQLLCSLADDTTAEQLLETAPRSSSTIVSVALFMDALEDPSICDGGSSGTSSSSSSRGFLQQDAPNTSSYADTVLLATTVLILPTSSSSADDVPTPRSQPTTTAADTMTGLMMSVVSASSIFAGTPSVTLVTEGYLLGLLLSSPCAASGGGEGGGGSGASDFSTSAAATSPTAADWQRIDALLYLIAPFRKLGADRAVDYFWGFYYRYHMSGGGGDGGGDGDSTSSSTSAAAMSEMMASYNADTDEAAYENGQYLYIGVMGQGLGMALGNICIGIFITLLHTLLTHHLQKARRLKQIEAFAAAYFPSHSFVVWEMAFVGILLGVFTMVNAPDNYRLLGDTSDVGHDDRWASPAATFVSMVLHSVGNGEDASHATMGPLSIFTVIISLIVLLAMPAAVWYAVNYEASPRFHMYTQFLSRPLHRRVFYPQTFVRPEVQRRAFDRLVAPYTSLNKALVGILVPLGMVFCSALVLHGIPSSSASSFVVPVTSSSPTSSTALYAYATNTASVFKCSDKYWTLFAFFMAASIVMGIVRPYRFHADTIFSVIGLLFAAVLALIMALQATANTAALEEAQCAFVFIIAIFVIFRIGIFSVATRYFEQKYWRHFQEQCLRDLLEDDSVVSEGGRHATHDVDEGNGAAGGGSTRSAFGNRNASANGGGNRQPLASAAGTGAGYDDEGGGQAAFDDGGFGLGGIILGVLVKKGRSRVEGLLGGGGGNAATATADAKNKKKKPKGSISFGGDSDSNNANNAEEDGRLAQALLAQSLDYRAHADDDDYIPDSAFYLDDGDDDDDGGAGGYGVYEDGIDMDGLGGGEVENIFDGRIDGDDDDADGNGHNGNRRVDADDYDEEMEQFLGGGGGGSGHDRRYSPPSSSARPPWDVNEHHGNSSSNGYPVQSSGPPPPLTFNGVGLASSPTADDDDFGFYDDDL